MIEIGRNFSYVFESEEEILNFNGDFRLKNKLEECHDDIMKAGFPVYTDADYDCGVWFYCYYGKDAERGKTRILKNLKNSMDWAKRYFEQSKKLYDLVEKL
jgi:hypothetical protein